MKWPAVIPPGMICNKIVSSIDILPTVAHIGGVELPPLKIDGIDFLSLLRCEEGANPRREFYYYLRNNLLAVRRDNWKLVHPHECKTNVGAHFGKDGRPGTMRTLFTEGGLYNLNTDPGERYDLKDSFPEIVHELQELSGQIRRDLGDELQKMKGNGVRLPGTMNGN
jgi:arylsulfatase